MDKALEYIFQQDQKDRKNWQEWGKTIPLDDVKKRTKKYVGVVLGMLKSFRIIDGADYYHAAVILQHSDETQHYELANDLCVKAIELGENRAKWLYAATLDRYMLSSGSKFQKFGTQFAKNDKGLYEISPTDPATTDAMRAEYNVPSLEKLQERVTKLNSEIKK